MHQYLNLKNHVEHLGTMISPFYQQLLTRTNHQYSISVTIGIMLNYLTIIFGIFIMTRICNAFVPLIVFITTIIITIWWLLLLPYHYYHDYHYHDHHYHDMATAGGYYKW